MNNERKNFQKKIAESKPSGTEHPSGGSGAHESGGNEGGGSHTKIEHHEDGTHTIHHADGETSGPHPSMSHAAMYMAAKHDGGEHGHIMPHAGGATTHHVDMTGEVQGPMEHGSEDEAYDHLRGSIGDGAEMAPEGDDHAYVSGREEDSSFE